MGRHDEEKKSMKRKRNHEKDQTNNVKVKRRKNCDNDDEDNFHLPEDVYNEERDDHSDLSQNISMNNTAHADDYVIYLVRKPASLSMDQLSAVPLPKNATKVKRIELRTDDGTFTVKTGALCERMMHISTETACGFNSGAVRPDGMISGVVTISVKTPEDLPLGQIFEEGDEITLDTDKIPAMKSVRNKPRNKPKHYKELSERLVAYGVKRSKRRPLPGLKPIESE